MDNFELEIMMIEQLDPLGFDILTEKGGYSLYDRMMPEGRQMLCNVPDLNSLWPDIFRICRLERK